MLLDRFKFGRREELTGSKKEFHDEIIGIADMLRTITDEDETNFTDSEEAVSALRVTYQRCIEWLDSLETKDLSSEKMTEENVAAVKDQIRALRAEFAKDYENYVQPFERGGENASVLEYKILCEYFSQYGARVRHIAKRIK